MQAFWASADFFNKKVDFRVEPKVDLIESIEMQGALVIITWVGLQFA